MIDNWQKFNDMSADKLFDEIKLLNSKLAKLPPSTSVRGQLLEVIQMAQTAYNEKMFVARHESTTDENDGVVEIGEIESHVSETVDKDYVNIVASTYVSRIKK